MKRQYTQDPLAEEFKPSLNDAAQLTEDLKGFQRKQVNGRWQYPFELYLNSIDVIRFGKFGEIIIKKPMEFHRLGKVNSLRKWKEEKDLEAIFQQFPEEKVVYDTRIKKITDDISAFMRKIKIEHE